MNDDIDCRNDEWMHVSHCLQEECMNKCDSMVSHCSHIMNWCHTRWRDMTEHFMNDWLLVQKRCCILQPVVPAEHGHTNTIQHTFSWHSSPHLDNFPRSWTLGLFSMLHVAWISCYTLWCHQTWLAKIPSRWRFLARKSTSFYGPFSSHVWWHRRVVPFAFSGSSSSKDGPKPCFWSSFKLTALLTTPWLL